MQVTAGLQHSLVTDNSEGRRVITIRGDAVRTGSAKGEIPSRCQKHLVLAHGNPQFPPLENQILKAGDSRWSMAQA